MTNVLYWSFICIVLILIDGFRRPHFMFRGIFYFLVAFKALCEIIGTWVQFIDNTVFLETPEYFKNHKNFEYAIYEIIRLSWVVLFGIALIGSIETFSDPKHSYFVMYIK